MKDGNIRKQFPALPNGSILENREFGPKILPPEDFHVVKITVVHDTVQRCLAKTAPTLPTTKKTCIEYYSACTVGADKTRVFLLRVSFSKWKSSRRKTFHLKCFPWEEFQKAYNGL